MQSSKVKDLTGQRFGSLTVIEFAGVDKHDHAKWRCRCKCGSKVVKLGRSLTSGNTKSCGACQAIRRKQPTYNRLDLIRQAVMGR